MRSGAIKGVVVVLTTAVLGPVLGGLQVGGKAQAQRAGEQVSRDGAIRRLHARVDAAWNDGDAARFAANWTRDGVLISPMGARSSGRAAIAGDIAGTLVYLRGTTHKLNVESIHWPRPDVAVADGEAVISNLKDSGGAPLPPLTSRFTSVSVEHHGQWLIAHLVSYTFLPTNPAN